MTAPDGVPDALKQVRYGTAAFGPPVKDNLFGPAPYLSDAQLVAAVAALGEVLAQA